jgi:ERCC4-type nuclease
MSKTPRRVVARSDSIIGASGEPRVSLHLDESAAPVLSIVPVTGATDVIERHVPNEPAIFFETAAPPPAACLPKLRDVTVNLAAGETALARALAKAGCTDAVLRRLDYGDVVFTAAEDGRQTVFELAIERKAAADFVSSIVDGRMATQAAVLAQNVPDSAWILYYIEGDPLGVRSGLCRNARLANLVYPITRRTHSIVMGTDTASLARFVVGIREFLQTAPAEKLAAKGLYSARAFGSSVKKADLAADNVLQIQIGAVPDVGPKTAEALAKHFGTFSALAAVFIKNGPDAVAAVRMGERAVGTAASRKICKFYELDQIAAATSAKRTKICDEDE